MSFKRDIRLLKLLPRDINAKLKWIPACQIIHTGLDSHPEFVALSYVWGDAKDSRVILVEKHRVRVTKNLYEAMMALRPLKEPILIWIDALCINQADEEEKSWQVGLMAEIYRHAFQTHAWLGPADESSDSVMDYLNALGAKAEACCMDDHLFPVASMKSLFTRPWWGRVWVLQEITVPKNAEFVCGTKKITRSRCSVA
ncbi:HET-domain-containing protein, partial [Mytilinidion resinicola]